MDTGQHVHRGDASCDGTHNVGLKAVAHCHRVRGTNELARTAVDTRLGLATGGGTLAGRVLNRTHQRAIAERLAALDGQGRVKVRGIEGSTAFNRESSLGQECPVNLLVEALHDGSRLVVGTTHQLKALLFESLAQTGTAEYEDLGTLVEFLRHDGGNVHSRRHDHLGGRLEVHAVELVGHLLLGTHRVVRDERGGHAHRARLDNGRGSVLDPLVTGPRRTIEVKQRAVIFLGQCILAAAQRRTLIINVGVLEQGNVNDLGILNLGGHLRNDSLGFVHATQFRQALSLDLHETAAELVVGRFRQHGKRIVDDHEADVGLTEVSTCTRGDEHQLDLFRKIQSRGVGCVDDLNGLLGVAKPALRVGFDSAQRVIPTHPSHGAHFAQRLLITTRGVRGQSSGLANDIDPTRAAHSSLSMLVGGLGIEINQLTGHHQMTCNNVTVRTRQRRQRAHSITVKLLGTHASRNRRLIAVRRHVLVSRRIVLVGDIVAPLILTRPATVTLKTTALTSVTAEATATIITTLEATPAIITSTKIAALTITTLEITLTVPTIITTETTAVVTTLVTATIIVAFPPLGLTLRVITTTESAASLSLFCHGA